MNQPTINLRRFALFAGLPDAELQSIAPNLTIKRFDANQVILRQNETPAFVMIVVSGQIQSTVINEEGRVVALSFANTDETIGWECIVDGMPLAQTLATTRITDLLLIPTNVARMLMSSPWVTAEVMRILTKSIRRLTDDHRVLSLPNAYQRVYTQILNLANVANGSVQTTHLPKQQEIAVMVNTSRETVSRALQALIRQGILAKSGHQILIKDAEKLRQLATEGAEKQS